MAFLADGREVPDECVAALDAFETIWPGATLHQARAGIVAAVLDAIPPKCKSSGDSTPYVKVDPKELEVGDKFARKQTIFDRKQTIFDRVVACRADSVVGQQYGTLAHTVIEGDVEWFASDDI